MCCHVNIDPEISSTNLLRVSWAGSAALTVIFQLSNGRWVLATETVRSILHTRILEQFTGAVFPALVNAVGTRKSKVDREKSGCVAVFIAATFHS